MPRKKPADARIQIRCPKSDKDEFEELAEREGFSNVSQWLLWLARNRVKDARSK